MGNKSIIVKACQGRPGCWFSLLLTLAISCGGQEFMQEAASVTPGASIETASASGSKAPQAPATPIAFEPNKGQTNEEDTEFLGRADGYNLYITGNEIVFDVVVSTPSEETALITRDGVLPSPGESASVKFSLLGTNVDISAEGQEKLPGVSNYFYGNDPSQWITGVEQYEKVLCKEVYPGIDVIFYGKDQLVEHDFIVAPGADPELIQMSIEGAQELKIQDNGELKVVVSEDVHLTMKKLIIYQMVDSEQVLIEGTYEILGNNIVGFEIGAYDPSLELIIDPITHTYSTFTGGSTDDVEFDIALDTVSDGCTTSGQPCIVSVGYAKSTDRSTVGGPPIQGSSGGGSFDIFVNKFNSVGTAVTSSTYFGGNGDDLANSIKVDPSSGDIFITGYTTSTNFPTESPYQAAHGGGTYDAFLTRIAANGSSLIYSTYFGGSGFDRGVQIALDASLNVYMVGTTNSTSSIATSGVVQTAFGGGTSDVFIAKFDSTGNQTLGTYLGGSARDLGTGIVLDASATALAYVTGETRSSDFPTVSALDSTLGGTQDAFITKLNGDFTALTYSTYIGGSLADRSAGIALDTVSSDCTTLGSACVAIVGQTTSTDLTMTNANDSSHNGGDDIYVMKLNSAGSAVVYSTYLGGSGDDQVLGFRNISIDSNGEAWITGTTNSTDLPTFNAITGLDTYPTGSSGSAFVAKLASGTTAADWAFVTYLGGTTAGKTDIGASIVVDELSNAAYVSGQAETTDFPIAGAGADDTQNGGKDGFVAKFTTSPITFRAEANASADGASIQINVPAGIADNDVMLMAVAFNDDAVSATTPTGWTLVIDQAQTAGKKNNSGRLVVFSRVASSEPASYTVTLSNTAKVVGSIVSYQNVNPTNPLDGTPASAATANSTNHDAPSITTSLSNSMLITFHALTADKTWI
ncbi:MAG: SBBP repeat-containing protein, partial [Deltaproteobacteria bacterium]|nr:SBBP repeat-containing protein [Deltaproteobacteria bacterium]